MSSGRNGRDFYKSTGTSTGNHGSQALVEGAAAGAPTDTPAGYDLSYTAATSETFVSNISGWAKNTSYDNQITVTLAEDDVPGMDGTTPIYIHITGVTSSLPHDYNGVKLATPISGGSNNDFRIESKYSDTTSISAITAASSAWLPTATSYLSCPGKRPLPSVSAVV